MIEKRASDLLSMFVGESEKAIAQAFQEAADRRAVLILDEADSFLRDRAGAQRSWEVTQVNEMLTWMERHPRPFVCTTNLMDSLDPATLRRFVFKVKFLPMTTAQARAAFGRSFGVEAPKGLDRLDNLTPGDFAVVARKARVLAERDVAALFAMLGDEGGEEGWGQAQDRVLSRSLQKSARTSNPYIKGRGRPRSVRRARLVPCHPPTWAQSEPQAHVLGTSGPRRNPGSRSGARALTDGRDAETPEFSSRRDFPVS